MIDTPLTRHAGIEVPLICGAMYPCSNPELVAAVKDRNAARLRALLAEDVDVDAATADGSALVAAFGSHVNLVPLCEPAASPLPLVLAESAASGELARRELQFQEHLGRARELLQSGTVAEGVKPLRKARAVPGYELHQEALELWNRVLAHYPKSESRAVVELRRISGGRGPLTACGLTPDGSMVRGTRSSGSRQAKTNTRRLRGRIGISIPAIAAIEAACQPAALTTTPAAIRSPVSSCTASTRPLAISNAVAVLLRYVAPRAMALRRNACIRP